MENLHLYFSHVLHNTYDDYESNNKKKRRFPELWGLQLIQKKTECILLLEMNGNIFNLNGYSTIKIHFRENNKIGVVMKNCQVDWGNLGLRSDN